MKRRHTEREKEELVGGIRIMTQIPADRGFIAEGHCTEEAVEKKMRVVPQAKPRSRIYKETAIDSPEQKA